MGFACRFSDKESNVNVQRQEVLTSLWFEPVISRVPCERQKKSIQKCLKILDKNTKFW